MRGRLVERFHGQPAKVLRSAALHVGLLAVASRAVVTSMSFAATDGLNSKDKQKARGA